MIRIVNSNIVAVIIAFAFIIGSCKQEYKKPDGASIGNDLLISNSFGIGRDINIHKNQEMYFDNFSVGAEATTWTFPAEASPSIVSSTDKHVKVAFGTPGTYVANVQIEFASAYTENEVLAESNIYKGTIEFTVLGDIVPNFTAKTVKEDTPITIADKTKFQIFSGDKVIFEDASEGNAGTFSYVITNVKSGEEQVYVPSEGSSFQFKEVGTYSVQYEPTRKTLDSTYKAEKVVAELIEVVASTEPAEITNAALVGDRFVLTFNRPVADAAKCKAEAFSLRAFPAENLSYDMRIKIKEVSAHATDPAKVVLTLNEKVFGSDVLALKYDNTIGNLKTYDPIAVSAFENQTLVYEAENILRKEGATVHWDLEASTNKDWAYQFWGGVWEKYNQGANVSSAVVYEGKQSLYIDMEAEGGAIFKHKADADGDTYGFTITPGTYRVGAWFYVEALGNNTTGEGIYPGVMFVPTELDGDKEPPTWLPPIEFYEDTPVGKWFYKTTTWTVDGTEAKEFGLMLRPYNASSTVSTKVYMDNIEIVEVSVRPPGEF